MAGIRALERSDKLSRLAVIGVFSYAVGVPAIDVSLIFTLWTGGSSYGVGALVGTTVYLPLHLRHLWYAVRAERPPGGHWTLALMAIVIAGTFPFAGLHWLRALPPLIIGALIILRPPWSRWVAGILLSVPLPIELIFNSNMAEALWHGTGVLWRVMVLYVLVWLAASVHRLQNSRLALADEAVARERHRLDEELEQTLGAALESIVARGQRASARSDLSPAALEAELRALVDGARTTLAEARRMIRGYRQVSLRAELEAAASLLTAAGIRTELVLPRGDVPEAAEGPLRMALRSATSVLLRDDVAETCVITVTRGDGQVRLDVRADGSSLPTAEVVTV